MKLKPFQQIIDDYEGTDEAKRVRNFAQGWHISKHTVKSWLRYPDRLYPALLRTFNAHEDEAAMDKYLKRIRK